MSQAGVIFFDVRDTLGVIDRPGHLVPYRPTTKWLLEAMKNAVGLRVGIITNLPRNISSAQGRALLDEAGITPFLDPDGIVINHDVGVDKPSAEIYRAAAAQMGVDVDKCVFVGENLIEVIGATAAGMRAVLKPSPPGSEFKLKPIAAEKESETFSGRLSEVLMEDEHIVGKRIVIAAGAMAKKLEAGGPPPYAAMSLLVFLLHNFVDRFHHAKEEEVLLPLAFARGFPPERAAFVKAEHDQGREYFATLSTALERARAGNEKALLDFRLALQGFVELYREHGRKEDDELLPELGEHLAPMDDALIVDLMERVGPGDPGPWYALIAQLEQELGIEPGGTSEAPSTSSSPTTQGETTVSEIKTIGVLGYDQCGEQDTLVPWEIFKSLAWVLDTQHDRVLEVKLLGMEPGENITMQMGAQVVPEAVLETEDLFDVFYVPGGMGSGEATKNARILEAIRRHHSAGKIVATNCSGIAILHRAGILGDTPITGAATVTRRLKAEGANVVSPRRMWVGKKNGTIWTTVGGSGVHGSTVAFIANYFGEDLGRLIGMMWDTYARFGDDLFDEQGPEYYSYPDLEEQLQNDWEDSLLPAVQPA